MLTSLIFTCTVNFVVFCSVSKIKDSESFHFWEARI